MVVTEYGIIPIKNKRPGGKDEYNPELGLQVYLAFSALNSLSALGLRGGE
jgi:hypothetical protein